MSSKVGHLVSCGRCGREMGRLDEEEFFAFVEDESSSGLCFDCEPLAAQSEPDIFLNMQEGDIFTIGGGNLIYGKSVLGNLRLLANPPHEHTRARGLSSYTNLNRNNENRGILENLYDDRICPGCDGLSFNFDLYGVHPCNICGDKGSIKVLKKWVVSLIGGVVENV